MNSPKICNPYRFHKKIRDIKDDVLPGNVECQYYSVVGLDWHTGIVLQCKKCMNEFDFTAKEQLHWYEILKFWVDSVPVECRKCRGSTRKIVNLNKRLSKVIAVIKKDIDDYNEMVDIAAGMLDNGLVITGKLLVKFRMAAKRSDHTSKMRILDSIK